MATPLQPKEVNRRFTLWIDQTPSSSTTGQSQPPTAMTPNPTSSNGKKCVCVCVCVNDCVCDVLGFFLNQGVTNIFVEQTTSLRR